MVMMHPKLLLLIALSGTALADAPINIGSRLEPLVDNALIERFEGKAELLLHHPVARETAFVHDAPWEGSGTGYHSVFKDGDKYRMYYKAWHLDVQPGDKGKAKLNTGTHPLYTCYAESADGVHWTKPNLGIVEFKGSKDNNIVLASGEWQGVKIDAGHIALAKDENPNAAPDAKYKGFVLGSPKGLIAFKSPDGIHWSPMHDKPVITDGAFDSQNLAFWDGARGEYRAYWRYFTGGVTTDKEWKPTGHRAIRTATSKDFIHWENQRDLVYTDSPSEQLYTNVVKPYPGAPHLLIGFPTRYVERTAWSESIRALPEREHREMRASVTPRYGFAVTEGLLMTSRDGNTFHRWNDAFLRPGLGRPGTWNYGHQYIAWHIVETKAALEGEPNEFSLYAGESYWTGTSSELRRYTIRKDGFVSVHAPMSGGEMITKPFIFSGKALLINFSTSAAGSVRAEFQDGEGKAIAGFGVDDCEETFGDSLQRAVYWKQGSDVSSLAGKTVRLRLVLKDADVFSLRFGEP